MENVYFYRNVFFRSLLIENKHDATADDTKTNTLIVVKWLATVNLALMFHA